jgi:hypothetical protein
MPLSIRTRFEVFKRDEFRCRYCGRRSPEVVLEVDHIVPTCEGGTDDEMNLVTSCWECNRGKGGVPLTTVLTGEDPHDKAVELLERRRQLEEYNGLLEQARFERDISAAELVEHWLTAQGIECDYKIWDRDYHWLMGALKWCPREVIRGFMDTALRKGMTKNMKYVAVCCRNWRYEFQADRDTNNKKKADISPDR